MRNEIAADGLRTTDLSLSELESIYSFPVHRQNEAEAIQTVGPTPDRYHSGDWYGPGIKSLQDITKLVTHGWGEGAKRVKDMAASLAVPAASSIKRALRWNEQGGEIDADRAIHGEELMFRDTIKARTRGPRTIRIVTSWGGAAFVTAEQMFWTGAAAIVLSDVLEAAGYSTEIHTLTCNRAGDGNVGAVRVCVKPAGDPPSLPHIAALTAHAGTFRTYGFRAIIGQKMRCGSGLGSPVEASSIRPRLEAADLVAPSDILFDRVYDRKACVRQIASAVEQIEDQNAH